MFEVVSSQFFLRSESGHEFKWLPAKRTGLGLADPSGLPIFEALAWRETT